MPLYVYAVIEADGSDGESFEVLQDLNEPALTKHPETGQPVRRLLSAANTLKKTNPANISDRNLERLGFTKYKKAGGGKYEKTAGKGPSVISRE